MEPRGYKKTTFEKMAYSHKCKSLSKDFADQSLITPKCKSIISNKSSRVDATKIAILITDGWSYNTKASVKAATMLKIQGIFLYAIGIGKNILQKEIDNIASDPKRKFSFKVKTRREAIKLAKELIDHTCK
ncbi:hypothetical protein KUTeg_005273, partial [Tegillarca granosa]